MSQMDFGARPWRDLYKQRRFKVSESQEPVQRPETRTYVLVLPSSSKDPSCSVLDVLDVLDVVDVVDVLDVLDVLQRLTARLERPVSRTLQYLTYWRQMHG
ncbi:hypothetical protein NL108_014359 [Boleophthalmus pectinirostris]|nr:hypothetical protein NL108_014359 [Boleophthalmus pectinirostris]